MKLREQVTSILRKYGLSEGAIAVGVSCYCSVRAVEKLLANKMDDEVRVDLLQMMIDFSMLFPASPWLRQHGNVVMPIFALAVNAKLDAYAYLKQDMATPATVDRTALRVRAIATSAVLREFVVGVAMADLGPVKAKDITVALRDDMSNLERMTGGAE